MNKKKAGLPAKRAMRLFAAVLAAAALLAGTVTAFAADDDEYTYTVRIFAGNQGVFTAGGASENGVAGSLSNDGKMIVYTGLKAGDRVRFDPGSVKITNAEKYYTNHMRESGKDNYDQNLQSVEVTEDADYVAAYGVKGAVAAYTVRYIDTEGNEVYPPDRFYGNVGETTIAGARFKQGFFPDAHNKQFILAENNTIIFTYQPIRAPEPSPVPEVTATPTPTGRPSGEGQVITVTATPTPTTAAQQQAQTPAGTNATPTPVPAAPTAAPAASQSSEEAAAPADNAESAQTAEAAPEEAELPSSPEEVPELEVIGEEEVPQAVPDEDAKKPEEEKPAEPEKPAAEEASSGSAGLSGAAVAGIAAGAIVLIAGIAALVIFLSRKRNEDRLE